MILDRESLAEITESWVMSKSIQGSQVIAEPKILQSSLCRCISQRWSCQMFYIALHKHLLLSEFLTFLGGLNPIFPLREPKIWCLNHCFSCLNWEENVLSCWIFPSVIYTLGIELSCWTMKSLTSLQNNTHWSTGKMRTWGWMLKFLTA